LTADLCLKVCPLPVIGLFGVNIQITRVIKLIYLKVFASLYFITDFFVPLYKIDCYPDEIAAICCGASPMRIPLTQRERLLYHELVNSNDQ